MANKITDFGGTDWVNGDMLSAEDLIESIIVSSHCATPIGTVQSWLKSYTNVPTLPFGWVECNGQTLSDAESLFDGQVIPDLNNTGRFLKGATTSGTATNAQSHNHQWGNSVSIGGLHGTISVTSVLTTPRVSGSYNSSGSAVGFNNSSGRMAGVESQNSQAWTSNVTAPDPTNYTVVFIMRVK